jgi:hypothetical protein
LPINRLLPTANLVSSQRRNARLDGCVGIATPIVNEQSMPGIVKLVDDVAK